MTGPLTAPMTAPTTAPVASPMTARRPLATSSAEQDLATSLEQAQREIVTLRAGLDRRTLIGQAIGITMVRQGLTTDAALAHLVRRSQNSNVKVRDVAQVVVDEENRRAAGGLSSTHPCRPLEESP